MQLKKAQKRKLKNTKRKYSTLPPGSTWHFLGDTTIYVKICDAFSLNNSTGKDIIPGLFQQVVFTGFQKDYYPIWSA